ncbi:MAG: beta-mannosidase [Pyrinomonadaceae bacterium]
MIFKSTGFFLLAFFIFASIAFPADFVYVKDGRFYRANKLYRFVGTNYWYGGLLALRKDPNRGILRLRKELDFLKKNGVKNLRILGGAEGTGLINNVYRVGPALQPSKGEFNKDVLRGLDVLLDEMAKRDMKAVIFFSNNWEWSGGFQQYLIWNGIESPRFLTQKPSWDEYRDIVSKFYTCQPCKEDYQTQLNVIMNRVNSVNGKAYTDDATIMAWELANEPRPMRSASNEAYKKWIAETAAHIKSKDSKHLVTIGHEGYIGTESAEIFKEIHADQNIDYLTIHIWAKNWGWLDGKNMEATYKTAVAKATEYVNTHIPIAKRLRKPLVIEEFGFPRDEESFSINSTTKFRDRYFKLMFSFIGKGVEGANFWAFGGTARPISRQVFWKKGDDYMGDPPMEEQGLNTVFDSDESTWRVIRGYSK